MPADDLFNQILAEPPRQWVRPQLACLFASLARNFAIYRRKLTA